MSDAIYEGKRYRIYTEDSLLAERKLRIADIKKLISQIAELDDVVLNRFSLERFNLIALMKQKIRLYENTLRSDPWQSSRQTGDKYVLLDEPLD